MAPRILFLDDDPVIRVLRMVLSDAEHDPWIRDYFAPEKVDASRLARAAKGLRRSDGAVIGLASDGEFEDATAILFRRGEVNRQLLARHPRVLPAATNVALHRRARDPAHAGAGQAPDRIGQGSARRRYRRSGSRRAGWGCL